MTTRISCLTILLACFLSSVVSAAANPDQWTLENSRLKASFDQTGLVSLYDKRLGRPLGFRGDHCQLQYDGEGIDSRTLDPVSITKSKGSLVYRYQLDRGTLEVVYELQRGWGFLSKHLRLRLPGNHRTGKATVFSAQFSNKPLDTLRTGRGAGGVFVRFGATAGDASVATVSLFAAIQNPFLRLDLKDDSLALGYDPDIDWSDSFESDRVCLGMCSLSGTRYPARMVPEWHYLEDPVSAQRQAPAVDINEVLALSECVSAFTTYRPTKSVRIHVDWCENAYQLDVSRPEHWEEYKRIILRASELGCDYLLYSPGDLTLAPQKENRDAWGWEQLLWLNMGQKIRKGEWIPGKDTLPEVVKQRLDFAKKHGIKLVAYAYPSVPFMQNPQWTAWTKRTQPGRPVHYLTVDTGMPSFQDWWINNLCAFQEQTGLGGYAFDHWWIAYKETDSSKYAQWYGCRRILLELRRRMPEILMDGRQQYQTFGPWTWLGGSYPHPMASDEQPGSFRAFPDLHFSRVSANRTRSRNYWYRMENFCPVQLVPGYTTHQTMRSDQKRTMRRDPYRRADWDYLGWKYSVISSIATAPINHVINYLPARHETEYALFPEADKTWHRQWLDWTDEHRDVLKKVRPIIGQPLVGRCDGTAAIDGDKGFVFLFNPNYRPLTASFTLDESIGVTAGREFVFRQLYPDAQKGRLLGHPEKGPWIHRDTVAIAMPGASAMVLELVPLNERITSPLLLNLVGEVKHQGADLVITKARGEIGTTENAVILLPPANKPAPDTTLTVNGAPVKARVHPGMVTAKVPFAGRRFGKLEQIGRYDPAFAGRTFTGEFTVPRRVVAQLADRKKVWNIPYNEEEIKATWNAPWRMHLFINVADPQNDMRVAATLDGEALQVKKAYSDVYGYGAKRTFVGFYVDLSEIVEPERRYELKVELPEGLKPGQFQGVFFDNVEAAYSGRVNREPSSPPASTDPHSTKPNIILIMSDDMGFSDIGCYGGEIATPHLDRLAANGLRFTQFYNTARCCPTRAALLSGVYQHQAGIGLMTGNRRLPGYQGNLGRHVRTIAEALGAGGYRSYMAGKWHVTSHTAPHGPKHNWPLQRGFEKFYGTITGAGSFYDPATLCRGNTYITPVNDPAYRPEVYYYTDAISDNAVTFLKEHAEETPEKPFFIYVAYTTAHWPMHALPRDTATYKGRYDGGFTPTRRARYDRLKKLGMIKPSWELSPQADDWEQVKEKAWEARNMEVYAAMIDSMDQGIGRIASEVLRQQKLENTLILFLQDNGGCAEGYGRHAPRRPYPTDLKPMGPDDLQTKIWPPMQTRDGRALRHGPGVMAGPEDTFIGYGRGWANVSNTPFREYKHFVHEGGISTPLVVHWPAGIDVTRNGTFVHQPGHVIDIMATCIDVAGAPYPTRVGGEDILPIEGASLRPTFRGKPIDRKDALYFEHHLNCAIRDGTWKLVRKGVTGKGLLHPWELYNMETDRTEMHDLAGQHPEKVAELADKWEKWAVRARVKPWPYKTK